MSENFNWKPYYIGAAIVACLSCVFSWKVCVGIVIGSIFYYLNDRLNLKKFPKLDGNVKAIGSMLAVMAIQGILVVAAGIGTWYIGKLPCFIACFVALVAPTIYFFIVGSRR